MAILSQADQEKVGAMTKILKLFWFCRWKNNLDRYLLQLKRYATIVGWKQDTRVIWLRLLLTGKALAVCSGFSSEDAGDCDKLQICWSLFYRYNFTDQEYHERFIIIIDLFQDLLTYTFIFQKPSQQAGLSRFCSQAFIHNGLVHSFVWILREVSRHYTWRIRITRSVDCQNL